MGNSLSRKKRHKRPYIYFLAPSIITMFIVIILPFLYSIVITFFDVNLLENGGKWVFAGLKNFKTFLKDERVWNSIFVTLKFVFSSLFIQFVLGTSLALFFDRKFKGRRIIRSLLIMPMFMTPVVVGVIWRAFYDPINGLINYYLMNMGIIKDYISWLGNINTSLPAVLIAEAWRSTAFMFLLPMASLDSVSGEIYESALVEGANELQIIRFIKIPILIPTFFVAIVLRLVDLMKAFDLFYTMTKGGPGTSTETINMYAYLLISKMFIHRLSIQVSYVSTAYE